MSTNSPKTGRAFKPSSVLRPQTKASKITKGSPSKTSPSEASPTKASSSPSKTSPTKGKSKRSYDGSVFGNNLPSRRLRFPESGNVTAIEQIVFLTEAVRSHDPLNRLVQHGMDTTTFTFIVNQCRTFPKYPLSNNTACILLQNTMREWGHEDWTFGKHESGLYQCFQRNEDDLTFDEMEMDRGDSLKPKRKGGRHTENIPFEALAIDVTRLPDGDDALDLTGCVIWALSNPNSGLLYPRDFQWLTDQLGGAKPVLPANQDRQSFQRWNTSRKAHKKLSISASLAITKAEADYQKDPAEEEDLAAAKALSDAKAKRAELNTAGDALVTVDKGVITIHQDKIPPSAEVGPDSEDIADYLAQYKAFTISETATMTEDNGSITSPSRQDQMNAPQDHLQAEDGGVQDQAPSGLQSGFTQNTQQVFWQGEWTPSFDMSDGEQQESVLPKPSTSWSSSLDVDDDMDYDRDVPIDSIETDYA